ncbi:TIGR04283 family arsenosugar biosynthesis glycosyltransferase [Sulfitobacter sp. LCG007]
MRAPVSVIVPTLNAEPVLGSCLHALMPGLEAGLIRELIVSDGGSDDGTVALARAWGATVIEGAPSRGGQLRRGCEAAKGSWMLVLHADTVLAPGWVEPVLEHLGTQKAGWFRLGFVSGGARGRLVALWANLRSRMGLPYGDQGLLVPAQLYRDVGGYPDQPLMEDVALVRALRGRLARIDARAMTSAGKYHRGGWLRRGSRNLWTLTRYGLGASPERLAQDYNR